VEKPLGIIDSISAGFRVVQRHPWLIILPLLVDIWLWLGPHLSISQIVELLLKTWPTAELPSDISQMVIASQEMLRDIGQQFNLFWLVSNSLTWFNVLLPGLVAPARFAAAMQPQQVQLATVWIAAPLALAAGLGLGSAFIISVTAQMQPATGSAGFWLRRGLRVWGLTALYALALSGMLLAVLMISSLGLSFLLLLAPSLATPLASLGVLLGGWVLIWFYLILYFVVAALAWDGATLRQAVWYSANVVGRNFWSTLGLIVLITVILGGFQFIWQRLAQIGPWLVIVCIAGNAFLLTGLTAARLVFFQDRLARWQKTLVTAEPAIQA
jgi:hypothetical protein